MLFRSGSRFVSEPFGGRHEGDFSRRNDVDLVEELRFGNEKRIPIELRTLSAVGSEARAAGGEMATAGEGPHVVHAPNHWLVERG